MMVKRYGLIKKITFLVMLVVLIMLAYLAFA